jgi:menaquinone-dependent protoporphyrinogen oxidase
MKILITYYTKTQTTSEAAGEIAGILKQQNHEVDIIPLASVSGMESYEAVVIGAPINAMNWHPDATRFVETHREALSKIPVAYYFMSYLLYTGRTFWKKIIRKSLKKVSTVVSPVSVGMFGGKVDKAFPAPARLLFGVAKQAPSDVRDMETVRIWAKELSAKMANPQIIQQKRNELSE